jgi:tetrahydromethanopterin S-methyltransferase subunit G
MSSLLLDAFEDVNPFNRIVTDSAEAINDAIIDVARDGAHHLPVVGDIWDAGENAMKKIGGKVDEFKTLVSDKVDELGGQPLKDFKKDIGIKENKPLTQEHINNKLDEIGITKTEELKRLSELSAKDRLQFAELKNRYHDQLNAGSTIMADAELDGMRDLIKHGHDGKQPIHETHSQLHEAFHTVATQGEGVELMFSDQWMKGGKMTRVDKIKLKNKLISIVDRETDGSLKQNLLKILKKPSQGKGFQTQAFRIDDAGKLQYTRGGAKEALFENKTLNEQLINLINGTDEISEDIKEHILTDGKIPESKSSSAMILNSSTKQYKIINKQLDDIKKVFNTPLSTDEIQQRFTKSIGDDVQKKILNPEKIDLEIPSIPQEIKEPLEIKEAKELLRVNNSLLKDVREINKFNETLSTDDPTENEIINGLGGLSELETQLETYSKDIDNILKNNIQLNKTILEDEKSLQEANLKLQSGLTSEGVPDLSDSDIKKFSDIKENVQKNINLNKTKFGDNIKTLKDYVDEIETANNQLNNIVSSNVNEIQLLEQQGKKIPPNIIKMASGDRSRIAQAAEQRIAEGQGIEEGVEKPPPTPVGVQDIDTLAKNLDDDLVKLDEGDIAESGEQIDLTPITDENGDISSFDKVKEWYDKQNFTSPFDTKIYNQLKDKITSGGKSIGRGTLGAIALSAGALLTLGISKLSNIVNNSDDIPDEVKNIITGALDTFKDSADKVSKKGIKQIDKEIKELGNLILSTGALSKGKSDILSLVNNPSTSTSENLKNRRDLNKIESELKNAKSEINTKSNKLSRDLQTAKRQADRDEKKKEAEKKAKETGDEQTEKAIKSGIISPTLQKDEPMRFVFNISNENKPDSSRYKKTIKPSFSNQVDNSITQKKKAIKTISGNDNVFKKHIEGKNNKVTKEFK